MYFGRCLGAVIGVLAVAALFAAGNATVQPFFFGITIASFAMMVDRARVGRAARHSASDGEARDAWRGCCSWSSHVLTFPGRLTSE